MCEKKTGSYVKEKRVANFHQGKREETATEEAFRLCYCFYALQQFFWNQSSIPKHRFVIMSRKRYEFEHRTSIFEGAYRAWSHFEGLDPKELRSKTASELDPVNHTIVDDIRILGFSSSTRRGRLWLRQHRGSVAPIDDSNDENDSGNTIRVYPHENLPVSGLVHPYIQSILDAWLRPNGDREAGLAVLKTWWNHRRNGQSKSAQTFLGTVKMKGILHEHTSYFFAVAYNLEVNNSSGNKKPKLSSCLPPCPTPQFNTRKSDPVRRSNRRNNGSKRNRLDEEKQPLGHHERPNKRMKNQSSISNCLPGALLQDQHREEEQKKPQSNDINASSETGSSEDDFVDVNVVSTDGEQKKPQSNSIYASSETGSSEDDFGDIIVVTTDSNHNAKEDVHQIAFSVEGITCVHCITVIETLLNGCEGNTPPIEGILSAVADMTSSMILIQIDNCKNADGIAMVVKQHLAMLGYIAQVKKTMCILTDRLSNGNNGNNDTSNSTYYEHKYKESIFDWDVKCTCLNPLNQDTMKKCERHGNISKLTFEAFSLDLKDDTGKEKDA